MKRLAFWDDDDIPVGNIKDTVKESGLQDITKIEYEGNFTIKYYNREQLDLLRSFFGASSDRFDMKLLEKRKTLEKALKDFNYKPRTF